MANKFEHALAAVCTRLAATDSCPEQVRAQLASTDPVLCAAAAMEAISALARAPKVLVKLDADGDDPGLWMDREVDVAVLRFGKDLARYDEKQDVFQIEDQFLAGGKVDVVGARHYPVQAADYVRRAFDALDFHRVSQVVQDTISAPEVMARRFRVEWTYGYDDRAAEEHPIAWFCPDRGFQHDCIHALVALDLRESHEEAGPADKVTITRIA